MKLAIIDIETTGFVREKNNSIVIIIRDPGYLIILI
jgi:uncharacterized protein YprB with RNaseH-like and TPR domain